MRTITILMLGLLAASSAGCHTHHMLRRNVNRQTATLTDILYTQVLDNVALQTNQPGALPHFAVIGDGTTQATDVGGAEASLVWNPFGLVSESARSNGSRSLQENWKLQPVMSAGRLQRMQCAFQLALQGASWHREPASREEQERTGSPCAERMVFDGQTCINCVAEMVRMQWLPAPEGFGGSREGQHFLFCTHGGALRYEQALLERLHCNFPQGWFQVSSGCDPPCQAVYVGRQGATRVWVDATGVEALSRFTMTVLQLATNDPPLAGKRLVVTRKYLDLADGAFTEVTAEIPGDIETYRFPARTKQLDDALERLRRVEQTLYANCGEKAGECHHEIHQLAEELGQERDRVLGLQLTPAQKSCALDCVGEQIRTELNLILPRVRDRETKENLEQIRNIQRTPPVVPNPLDRTGNSPFSKGAGGIEVGGSGAP